MQSLPAPRSRRAARNPSGPTSNWRSLPNASRLELSRWRIDTEVFQTITTDCHLKHPAVHRTTALVVLTMIRFLAYTLSLVFYHRQVRSHACGEKCDTFREFARCLAYGFIVLSPNTS